MVATGLVLAAIYAAAVAFFINSRPGAGDQGARQDQLAQEVDVSGTDAPVFPASDYEQSQYPRHRGRPLMGVNYTHHAFPDCTFHRTHIFRSYQQPGVAEKVHDQLVGMRRSGLATIRTVLWHDAKGQDWGPIPSAGGHLREPYRTNLIRYVREVRKLGFSRLTIAFEPERTHNPLRRVYTSAKFAENWRLIRTVRDLVKRHGPRNTRFDLFSEGAPNEKPTRYEPLPRQTEDYIRRLYRLYVNRYGNRDVSISVIGSMKPAQQTNRLENLIRTLRSSGAPLPRWYDVHVGYEAPGAAHALRQAKVVLSQNGQRQPVVIGDAGYDNPGVARVIKRAFRNAPQRLQEVTPWYTHTLYGCPVTPPYSPGAYGLELQD